MSRRYETEFIHAESGLPVVISMGIGSSWSVYIQKPNGSLRRCKQFEEHPSIYEALGELLAYKGKAVKRKGAA
jgi:hypothetical protein